MRRTLFCLVVVAILVPAGLSDVIERTYTLPEPVVQAVPLSVDSSGNRVLFQDIRIPGLPSNADAGSPVIPVLPVRILLPQGHDVEKVEVVTRGIVQLKGKYMLPPSQRAWPLSMNADREPTPPDPKVYDSSAVYPERVRTGHQVQWCRGYGMVTFNLFPVRYEPSSQAVFYTPEMTVKVHTRRQTPSKGVMPCRGLAGDRRLVERMVENPSLARTYRGTSKGSGKHLPEQPSQTPVHGTRLPYIIVTSEALAAVPGPNNFQALLEHRRKRGMPGMIKTVESIYNEFNGQDDQEKIRNFCRFAYKTYQTEYLLLGGDGHDLGAGRIVPARGLFAEGEGYTEINIKADLYYGNLDGTFNYNKNSKWGEIGDGPGGGEVDLVSELFVGRASVTTPDDIRNFVSKTIAYEEDDFESPWYTRAHFVGEYLWANPDTWGGDYMDEIRDGCSLLGYTTEGFPASWSKSKQYERDTNWWPSQLLNILNSNDVHLVNHLGHASITMVMKIQPGDIEKLSNNRYYFIYSQGCNAGGFASAKCMAEYFTLSPAGAFGVIMNDKYGWGEVGSTDGSSQYFHRQFVDALFGEGIAEAGAANADSKADNLWCVNYKTNRWCLYETNLFGDPATPLVGPMLSRKGLLGLDRSAYMDGGTVQITCKDLDLNADPKALDTVEVAITATNGDAEEVVLTETGINTSHFSGTIGVAAGGAQPSSGTVELNHGQSFEVVYVDEDDGFGGANVPVETAAEADYVAPSISSIQVSSVDDTHAEVTWSNSEPCTGTLYYGQAEPLTGSAGNSHLLTGTSVEAEGLLPCTYYLFSVKAADAAGNETVKDNSGSYYGFTTLQRFYPLREELNEDPGWSMSTNCDWEWGQPMGESRDPTSGYTSPYVYGYNLEGAYGNNLGGKHLFSPPLDCSNLQDVTLDFWRLITILAKDNASLSVSDNGSTWTEIYHNPISPYIEPCWIHWTYDISHIADNKPAVYLRWTMGPTNEGGGVGGWNLDDVTVSGVAPASTPWLEYASHVMDDTAGGNGNGCVEPKETLTLPLTFCNRGLDAMSVSAKVRTFTPGITLLQDQASLPDIATNAEQTTLPPHFAFSVSQDLEDGDELIFGVDWTAGAETGSFTLIDYVACPKIVFAGVQVQEIGGDGDGMLDPGETAVLVVDLENIGSMGAQNVSAQIECSHPQYVTIVDPMAQYGDIDQGETAACEAPHFTVTVDPLAPNYTWLDFTLYITADNFEGLDSIPLEITDCNLQYSFDLDTNPGWTGTGNWCFGQPQGKKTAGVSAGCPDPASGFTGMNVVGYNLVGGYSLNMKPETLTSAPIDCSGFASVKVRFKRWLGVASAEFDHATFQVSTDGANWITMWDHDQPEPIYDNEWVHVEYDLSAVADHQPTVYLRWVMGPTSWFLICCGWNVDDIEIWGR